MATGQIDTLLNQGIEAVRNNEQQRARNILTRVIALDQHNEKAWLWLSSVVDSPSDKRTCLENALLINPDNTYAAMMLRHIRQSGQPIEPSAFPRLADGNSSTTGAGARSRRSTKASAPPAKRECPKCGFSNPGWAYLCDRCGAHLRKVDLQQEVRTEQTARQNNPFTILEAWGGALLFDRIWAFHPEIELASVGRTISALVLGALFVSFWRGVMSLSVWLLLDRQPAEAAILVDAARIAGATLPSALLLSLSALPITLLTWPLAALASGRGDFIRHLHLISVAFSALLVLMAFLVPLNVLLPSILSGRAPAELPLEAIRVVISVIVGGAGAIWLIQAVQTAQKLATAHAVVVAILATGIALIIFYPLNLFTDGTAADLVTRVILAPFLPLPTLGA